MLAFPQRSDPVGYHRRLGRELPVIAFYLYEAAGGVAYDDATLHAILELPEVVGIKVATLDSVMTFQRIAARSIAAGDSPEERWRATVRDGIALVKYVLGEVERTGAPLEDIDPFQSKLFTAADCASVLADADRYRAKLAAPATRARRCRLRLKGRSGGEVSVEGLVARNVQNASDPARCRATPT